MKHWGSPRLRVAASKMTGVRCYLDVEPDALARTLAPLGHVEVRGPPRRQICCELWHVTEGRVLVGGREREEWASVAREMGHLAGGWWGASMAWTWGALARPTGVADRARLARRWAQEGAARAGDFMAGQARDATHWTVVEPYHELLFTVPDVQLEGAPEPVSVVLGMVTDLPLALKIDRIASYGYDKRMAEFSTDGRHHWEVTVDGAPFLRAAFEPTGRGEAEIDRVSAAAGTIQPLLGGLSDRRLVLAELRRDLGASGDQLREVEGTVEVESWLFPLVEEGCHAVRSREAPPNRISMSFRGVDTFVTYPRPVR